MGSEIPDPEIRLQEIRQLCGGTQSDDNIREAGDKGIIKCRRDANGVRWFRFSSVVKWLHKIDRKRNAASKKAKERRRVRKD